MESLFGGKITVYPRDTSKHDEPYTPIWLDILNFTASNPGEFNIITNYNGRQVCRFSMKNVDIEITDDDWHLITSGVLDRFGLVPPKPLEEDGKIKLATLDIVEDRVVRIIQKADEIAAKAHPFKVPPEWPQSCHCSSLYVSALFMIRPAPARPQRAEALLSDLLTAAVLVSRFPPGFSASRNF